MTPQIAIEILKRYKRHWFGDSRHGGAVTVEQIIDMLTAQQEIIRCKDCAKREYCRTSTVWAVPPGDNWYCADATRRNDGDLISRQDAINAVDQIIARDASGNNDIVNALTAWRNCITGLPSAQPDLDALLKNLRKAYNMPNVPKKALSIIGDVMLALEGEKNE